DRIGLGKRDEKAGAAKNEPRHVPIPERCDRVHHDVAALFLRCCRKENSKTEVVAVEDHIERDGGADYGGPDNRKPVAYRVHVLTSVARSRRERRRWRLKAGATVGIPTARPPPLAVLFR